VRRLFLSVCIGSTLFSGPFLALSRAEDSPAQALYKQANDARDAADYATAAKDYQGLIAQYPSESFIPMARFFLGISFLYGGHPDDALKAFADVAADGAAPADIKGSAIFYSGQAAFAQAAAAKEDQRNAALDRAISFFTRYLAEVPQGEEREMALFFRVQANFFHGNDDAVQKDLAQLLADYPQSNSRTDYLYWSGRGYAAQAITLLEKDRAQALALGQKGLEAFRGIRESPDAAVAQNDAQLEAANLELALAQPDAPADLERALADYGKVLSKDALIPLQQKAIDDLSRRITAASVAGNKALSLSLIEFRQRQSSRLAELKEGPDPAVDALIRQADVLDRLKRYDEARVLLAYAKPFAKDAETRQRISYTTIMSFALQGLTDPADAALQKHLAEFANDPNATSLRYVIAQKLRASQQYAAAEQQFRKSLAETPTGRIADQSTLGLGAVLQVEKKYPEAETLLADYLKRNPTAAGAAEARYNLGIALAADNKPDEAVEQMRLVAADAKAGPLQTQASLQQGVILLQAKKPDAAIPLLQKTVTDFPKSEAAITALLYIGDAQKAKNDSASATASYELAFQEAADDSPLGPIAGARLISLRIAAGQLDQAGAVADRLAAHYAGNPAASAAARLLAAALEKQRNYDGAAARLDFVVSQNGAETPRARAQLASLWMNAARALGAYPALNDDEKKQWQTFTDRAEKAAIAAATTAPAAPDTAVALEELVKLDLARIDAGLATVDQATAALADLAAKASDPQAKGRFELARIAVIVARGHREEAAGLYAAAFQANPALAAGPSDLSRYGDALLDAKKYDEATAVYTKLGQAFPKDIHAQADSLYGLGAAQLGLGKTAEADAYFDKLEKQAPWSDKIWQAKLGRGLAAENRKETAQARTFYQQVVMSSAASPETKARGLFGFARTLETEGKLVEDPAAKDQPNAANNYLKIDALFDSAKEIAAEGLWRAGQVFEKANQPAKAKGAYGDLVKKYPQSPFAAQAADRLKALGTP